MNILLLVSAFLVLLSIGSYMISEETMASCLEKQSYSGAAAQRKVRNKIESERYAKIKGRRQSPLKMNKNRWRHKHQKKTKETPYVSHRDKQNPSDLSKLNLAPLFLPTPPSQELYETALRLIQLLYQKAYFLKGSKKNPLQEA